jgi:hypothetical protein
VRTKLAWIQGEGKEEEAEKRQVLCFPVKTPGCFQACPGAFFASLRFGLLAGQFPAVTGQQRQRLPAQRNQYSS